MYYQLGVSYAEKPAAKDYETLGIYVPGKYRSATKNSDGTYTATVNPTGQVGGFTAATAPIVLPINTGGYAAQRPPSSYSYETVSAHLEAGFVYVAAGMRGRDTNASTYTGNAPWGVADLKAAVRYLRLNAAALAGQMDRYEWNMGQFASTGTRAAGTWTKAYSDDLADAFAGYVNGLNLKDAKGTALSLQESGPGHYLAGTYYDHVLSVIQTSLNDFLATISFPYTPSTAGGMGGGPPGAGGPSGGTQSGSASSTSTTYNTVDEYIAHLNASSTWVSYDATTKTATVLNLQGFVTSQKPSTKDVGAFDGPGRNATENAVFGLGSTGLHFSTMAQAVMAAHESRVLG